MRWTIIIASAIALSGCSSGPSFDVVPGPNGKLMIGGDDNCVRARAIRINGKMQVDENKVECISKDGKITQRNNLTPQGLAYLRQLVALKQMREAQELQSLQQSMVMPQFNYMQMPMYTPPPIMPISPPGGNRFNCISTGFYTSCR